MGPRRTPPEPEGIGLANGPGSSRLKSGVGVLKAP